jgi:hypothetical protein
MSATLQLPGLGVSSGSGLAGAGRVHSARPFILPSFLNHGGSGGPRGATERCRATPSGTDQTHHRIGGRGSSAQWCGLLDPFYAAIVPGVGACRQLDPARGWIPAMYKDEPVTPKFQAGILATGTIIQKTKNVPPLLPIHNMQLQTSLRIERPSGRPAARLVSKTAFRDPSDNATPFSVAPRGPRSASVSKNPWPDTHSGSERRDTRPPYNIQRPKPFKRTVDGRSILTTPDRAHREGPRQTKMSAHATMPPSDQSPQKHPPTHQTVFTIRK